MPELIWDGKYHDSERKPALLRAAFPFQTVEPVNESAQERQRSLDFFTADRPSEWRNRLIWGDKKYVLPALLADFAGAVDLVYVDPPFFTGGDFSFSTAVNGEDFTREPNLIEQKAYRDTWGSGIDGYLSWFHTSLLYLHELLAQGTSSIYVHLDWHVGHVAKSVLDEVFGSENFRETLEDASIRLGSVASDVLGVSGRAMLRALIAGERDPEVLAELAKGLLRKKIPELREALHGRFFDHHGFLIELALTHVEQLEAATARLDAEVDKVMAPFSAARDLLDSITGVGKRAAECIIAEIGVDMGRFPTAGHLASWAAVCPGNNVTGGKRRSGKTRKGNVWLEQILVECAWAAARSKDTYLQAQFWRLARRIGKKRAAVAVGHSILVIAWHLLSYGCVYEDLGGDFFTKRDTDRARQRAIAQLEALGYHVSLAQVA